MLSTFQGDTHLKLVSNRLGNFSAPFTKLLDMRTKVVSRYNDGEIDSHLWIDIFPIDGLPKDLHEVQKIYKECDRYRRLLVLCSARLGAGRTSFRKYSKYILKPAVNLLYGKRALVQKMETVAGWHPYGSTDYVGVITWGLYGTGERMLKREFEQAERVEFEGHMFPAFSCWDSYLKGLYGDYMKLPPIEARKTHDMEVYISEE